MPEFTGNVHGVQLTLPFPTPAEGAGTVFVLGRTFGDPDGGTDGLDVWVDDTATTSYDPPDRAPLTLPVATLLACVHGWLRFVPAGTQVLELTDRTGAPLVVANDSFLLSVWPTLRDNLERLAEDGSVLVPQPEAGKGGRPALEHLIYENVDAAASRPAIEDLILEARPADHFSDEQRTAMADAFFDGELQILARAGRVLGTASAGEPPGATRPSEAGATWLRITLRAVDQLGQLFDPGYFMRRLRELADIVEVPLILEQKLIPSRSAIGAHPLPGLAPARKIVDWRDPHGRPLGATDFLLVSEGTDRSTATPKTTNAWGLWLGPTLAEGDGPLALVVASVAEHVAVGTLPNAPRSAFRLARHLLADDYLVLSAIDLSHWFPARPTPTIPTEEPLRRYTQGNRITPLVDGRSTLFEIYQAMRRTFRDDDFSSYQPGEPLPDGPLLAEAASLAHSIYLANWRLSPHLHLPELPGNYVEIDFDSSGTATVGAFDPRAHVLGVLRGAIEAGVEVRALLWRRLEASPSHRSNNTAAVAGINATSPRPPPRRGQAILDDVCRTTGSHHQKLTVIENADGRVAFLGGIDLALGRWDSPEHVPNDPRSQTGRAATPADPWIGWHDVHCRVQGPAVDDLEENFRQRWNHNPNAQTEGRTLTPSRPVPLDPLPEAPHFVQINRTIPPGLGHYQFVSPATGDAGILTARLNAVRQARRHIYLEEQYLTMVDASDHAALLASPNPLSFPPSDGDTLAAALRERLVGQHPVSFVAILLPRTLVDEPAFANMVLYALRRRFIEFLTHGLTDEQKRERLLVFHLRNRSGLPTYVHAKTMIVDDLWASIGSSNTNYRSTTYDSEINCDVVDGTIRKGIRPFARDLRVRLWAEHLGLAANERHLVLDPQKGFELLRRAAETDWPRPNHVQAYDPDYFGDDLAAPGAPPLYNPSNRDHEILRTHLVDPDGRDADDPLLDYAALLALAQSL
jgi:phosphatidylserine/phosphatidylglycerophosphate/cardiolipin synthase-like enzyme